MMQRVTMRVESASPGKVRIELRGAVSRSFEADFGLVPMRLAECLGAIAGAKLVLHELGAGAQAALEISAGDRDFVRYVLREKAPGQAEARRLVEHLWATLSRFGRWEIRHERGRKRVLEGSPHAGFPRGLFPWIKPCVAGDGESIAVRLPDCPAVRTQFLASLRTARQDGELFVLPASAEKALGAWLAAVRG